MLDDTTVSVDATTSVIEIDPTKKYILYMSGYPNPSELERLKDAIKEWLQGDSTFLVICGHDDNEVKLVKVE